MRPGITVTIHIPASPARVWEEVAQLDRHVEWMTDAHRIEFRSEERRGPGTIMAVETRFGPLRTTDLIEVTAWEEGRRIAVEHRGAFTGVGEFVLAEAGDGGTDFTWSERIAFPWYFGGRPGAWAARPIFRWVWRRNLARLRARLTAR